MFHYLVKTEHKKNTDITLVLVNNLNKDFQYGILYEIEIKKDGEWYRINIELNFNLLAFALKSKEIQLN